MSAGKLYERVAFESPVEVSDGYGGTINGWAAQFTVSAHFVRLRGGETVLASRLSGTQPTIIKVRQSSDTKQVTTDWRARDARSGEVFNIRSIIESDDRAYLEFTAESGVAV
jgi:SPP1 family predicted phage head-tail adaptor